MKRINQIAPLALSAALAAVSLALTTTNARAEPPPQQLDTVNWGANGSGASSGTLVQSGITVNYTTSTSVNGGQNFNENWGVTLATSGAVGTGVTSTRSGVLGTRGTADAQTVTFGAGLKAGRRYLILTPATDRAPGCPSRVRTAGRRRASNTLRLPLDTARNKRD